MVDYELPVLAFVDARDLSVEIVGSWFEESAIRDWSSRLEVCTALAVAEDGCWIASPDARGVVWLRRDRKSLFPMPAPVRALAYANGACWALLDVVHPYGRDPLPLWRLDDAGMLSFAAEFRIFDLIAAGDRIFALGYTPGDDDRFRVVVLGVADNGQVEVLAPVELRHGWHVNVHAGLAGPWLELDSAGAEWPAQRWIEPLERSHGGWQRGGRIPLPPGSRRPVALDESNMAWSLFWADNTARDYDHQHVVRRVPLDGSADSRLMLPGRLGPLVARGGHAWCVSVARLPQPSDAPQRSLLRLTHAAAAGIELATVEDWPGIDSVVPDIRPPDWVDPAMWAASQCASLQAELAAWKDAPTGTVGKVVDRVTIESVSLVGSYPAAECVIRFRLHDRQAIAFGRRIRCFDDMGAPRPCDYAALQLIEDIATGDLPPPGRDIPSEGGVVWI